MNPATVGLRTQDEERSTDLPVEGTLPGWLTGTYLVNGPGAFEAGDTPLRHWFDSFGMLRRFRIADGHVRYRNRYVESKDRAFAREGGGVRTPFPGTPPDRSLPRRIYQTLAGVFPDNPVVGVARVAGETLAVTESRWAQAVDPETLEHRGRVDETAGLDADLTLGHRHHVPADRAADGAHFLELGVSYGRDIEYTLFRRPDDRDAPTVTGGGDLPLPEPEPLTTLSFDGFPYLHAFALTGRFVVLPEIPFGLDGGVLLRSALTRETFLDAFTDYDRDARFHVLDRRTGDRVATVPADPFFVYHVANAYEAGGTARSGPDGPDEIVVDLVAFADERAVTDLTLANLRSDEVDLPGGDLVRFRCPLGGGRATREPLLAGPVEFPTVNYRHHNGQPHRYVYCAETRREGALPSHLAKVDTDRAPGYADRWTAPDCYPGEPVFVPAPDPDAEDPTAAGTAREDDGVVLSLVLDVDADRSFLLVLDARSLRELARAPLPHRLPFAFHGEFYGPTDPGRSVQ